MFFLGVELLASPDLIQDMRYVWHIQDLPFKAQVTRLMIDDL
jgi:hypothetical protein